jgi:hypothetical protein
MRGFVASKDRILRVTCFQKRRVWQGRAWQALAAAALLLPTLAHAGLGGAVDAVGGDPVRMQIRLHSVTPAHGGSLHTLALANGGELREYTNAAGMVYAVRWTGPGKPDLRTVLGPHFAKLQADNPISARHGIRRAPMVNRPDLKIITGGHTGAFWGVAWLPQAVPAGFDPAAL